MKTPCCLDSVNKCPETSSCSMILRSACSHGHSHKSLASNEDQTQNSEKKRTFARESTEDSVSQITNSKSSFQLESFLESSIKEIALKSTKTFSIWKESLYNCLEFSENQKNVSVQNGKNLKSFTEQKLIKTSTPISSLIVNDNSRTKDFVGNAHSLGSITSTAATMSDRRNLQRKSTRILSESDTDEESSYSENRVKLRRTTRVVSNASNSNATERVALAESAGYRSTNHLNSNNFSTSNVVKSVLSNSDYNFNCSTPNDNSVLNQRSFSVNSSRIDISAVHESMLDKLRWVLWRYIYLKIISSINFDVWLLSSLRGSKKSLLFLLPLMLYFLYSAMNYIYGDTIKSYDMTSSLLSSSSSHLFSILSSPFTSFLSLFEGANFHFLLPSFSTIPSYLSSLFVKTEEKTYIIHKTNTISKDSRPVSYVEALSRAEVESVAVRVLEERLADLVKTMQVSNTRDLQDVKGENAVLKSDISDLRHEFKSLSTLLQQFQNDVKKLEKTSAKDIETLSSEHKIDLNMLNTKIKAFEGKLDSLGTLKRCCDQKMDSADFIVSIEKHLVAAFKSVMGDDKTSPYHFFREWLNSKFTDPKALSSEINLAFEKLNKEPMHNTKQDANHLKIIEGVVHHYFESLKANATFTGHFQGFLRGSLSSDDVRKIVREAILLYDADKTGLVDYALESAGGSVLSIRCSESYTEKKGKLSLFGIPLWSDQNTPRTAIQPDVKPGQCWSFKGSQGFLVIELSYTVHPTGFTLEHIPVSLSPTGSIDSAPKDFSVWGLASETDTVGTLLGKYSYDDKAEPLQYFTVQNFTTEPFSYVELKIHSNHGNLEYTCLYRFRVHGTRVK